MRVDERSNHAYVLDRGAHVVRRIDLESGIIEAFAGNGVRGYGGDGGHALSASFIAPRDIVVDREGNAFISDPEANVVRRVDGLTEIITTVAGNGWEEPRAHRHRHYGRTLPTLSRHPQLTFLRGT